MEYENHETTGKAIKTVIIARDIINTQSFIRRTAALVWLNASGQEMPICTTVVNRQYVHTPMCLFLDGFGLSRSKLSIKVIFDTAECVRYEVNPTCSSLV